MSVTQLLYIVSVCCLHRYSLLGDNVERFQVEADSGLITTAVELDREEVQGYHLTLVAQDSSVTEPRASAVNLTITVLDENDNAPRFSSERYIVHVPDRTQPGTCNLQNSVHFISEIQHLKSVIPAATINCTPIGIPNPQYFCNFQHSKKENILTSLS